MVKLFLQWPYCVAFRYSANEVQHFDTHIHKYIQHDYESETRQYMESIGQHKPWYFRDIRILPKKAGIGNSRPLMFWTHHDTEEGQGGDDENNHNADTSDIHSRLIVYT